MIVFLFAVWRSVEFILSSLAIYVLPYQPSFAYPKDLLQYNLPRLISSFANFDGLYYLRIARFGYQQYEQVFFPLYPLAIRCFTLIFKNPLIAGLIISNLSLEATISSSPFSKTVQLYNSANRFT